MKKILCLIVALCLLVLCGCNPESGTPSTDPSSNPSNPANPTEGNNNPTEGEKNPTEPSDPAPSDPVTPPPPAGPTDLDFSSEVTALEGEWKLAQVFVDGNTTDAVENALTFKITLEVDPSELVDGPAYIHNQVYNLTGYLTFGIQSIVDELAADDVDNYKGSTSWEDFPQGEVVPEGGWYKQPGPASMQFRDLEDYGLYLDQIAGIDDDVDTMNKRLILGMNGDGQLLLGYSEEHLERPGTAGEWEYLLIFDKA